MDGNGEKARRFNLGRMGMGYLVVFGTMLIAGVLLWHAEEKIDPATVWVSIVGLAGVIVGYYFGSQTTDGGGNEE